MSNLNLETILSLGEDVGVEFKRCGNGIGNDTYETVCSFSNRFGGDIYLGVEDDGTVIGIPEKAVPDNIKNFTSKVSNPNYISPTLYLSPEIIEYKGKKIIKIHIPLSSEVHRFKKEFYDRVGDSDVKVTATSQISQMYNRKQNTFTEKEVYPHVKNEHLRLDLLPRIRQMAINRQPGHPWGNMSDSELLQSAGLLGEDIETGRKGYNLAAIMLLGRDHVIKNVCPAYRTDALLRKINIDRYDDRLIVETNLIESYDLLVQFAEKHLLDKFHLEGYQRVSLRGIIVREMISNVLIHREFKSSHFARLIIEKNRMFTENANRADTGDYITPDNYRPNPKNPIIAAFFRNIWLADELGSGVRKLFEYVSKYSGKDPEMIDGDIFKIIVPLDDNYSFDMNSGGSGSVAPGAGSAFSYAGSSMYMLETEPIPFSKNMDSKIYSANNNGINELRNKIVLLMREKPSITTKQIADKLNLDGRNVESHIRALKKSGIIRREGARKNGCWVVL